MVSADTSCGTPFMDGRPPPKVGKLNLYVAGALYNVVR